MDEFILEFQRDYSDQRDVIEIYVVAKPSNLRTAHCTVSLELLEQVIHMPMTNRRVSNRPGQRRTDIPLEATE